MRGERGELVVSHDKFPIEEFSGKRENSCLYLVDGAGGLVSAGAAARLHHVADVLSGSQQLGHVHVGLWPQTVSLRLIGPRHAVHLHLHTQRERESPGL